MSIAAELARLRSATGHVAAPKQAPSLLDDGGASSVPRDVVAGAARNALDALCAADPALEALAGPLLLLQPRADRATLPADEHSRLSAAVVELALRIAPALTLRPAQKLLEWVIGPLQTGALGSDDEVDALLLAALPFHASAQFPRLVRALLRPRGGAMNKGIWAWLAPVVVQGKPTNAQFILSEAPAAVLQRAIKFATDSAAVGVLNFPVTAFVANIVSRRVSVPVATGRANAKKSATALKVEQQALLLQAVSALEQMRKLASETGVEDDVNAGKQNEVEGERSIRAAAADKALAPQRIEKPLLETCAACLVVMTAGTITLGPGEPELINVVIKASCSLLVQEGSPELLRKPAFWCMLIGIRSGQLKMFPDEVFHALYRWGSFFDAIREYNLDSAALDVATRAYGMSAVHCTLTARPYPSRKAYGKLRECLGGAGNTMSHGVVSDLIVALLNGHSTREQAHLYDGEVDPSEWKSESNSCQQGARALAQLIAPFARGSYAEALDSAIGLHFKSRKSGSKHAQQYKFVDAVLAQALDDTQFAIVKAAVRDVELGSDGSTSGQLPVGTLIASLDHPESSIRKAAIQRVEQMTSVLDSGKGLDQTNEVGVALLRRISSDTVVSIACAAMESEYLLRACKLDDVIRACAKRLSSVLSPHVASSKLARQQRKASIAAMKLFRRIAESENTSESFRSKLLALLVILSANSLLPLEDGSVRQELASFLAAIGGAGATLCNDITGGFGDQCGLEPGDGDTAKVMRVPNLPRRALADAVVSLKGVDDCRETLLFDVHYWDEICGLRIISASLLWNRSSSSDHFLKRVLSASVDLLSGRPTVNAAVRAVAYDAISSTLRVLPSNDDSASEPVHLWHALFRIWNELARTGELDLAEDVISLLCRRGGTLSVVSFLQRCMWSCEAETNKEGRVIAIEMLIGFALTSLCPVEHFIFDLLAALYGHDADLRACCRRLVLAMNERWQSDVSSKRGEVSHGADEVRRLKKVISALARSLTRNRLFKEELPSSDGRDILRRTLKALKPHIDIKVHDTLDEDAYEEISRELKTALYVVCEKRDWDIVASIFRSFSETSKRGDATMCFGLACRALQRFACDLSSGAWVRRSAAEAVMRAFLSVISCDAFELDDPAVEELMASSVLFLRKSNVGEDEKSIGRASQAPADLIPSSEAKIAVRQSIACALAKIAVQYNVGFDQHKDNSKETRTGVNRSGSKVDSARSRVIDHLLWLAGSGSDCGSLVQNMLLSTSGLLRIGDYQRALEQLRSSLPVPRSMSNTDNESESEQCSLTPTSASGTAILELILRIQTMRDAGGASAQFGSKKFEDMASEVAPCLLSFIRDVQHLTDVDFDRVSDDIKYQMQLCLSALAAILMSDRTSQSRILTGDDARAPYMISRDESQMIIKVASYPSWQYVGDVSELDQSIRRSAMDVIHSIAIRQGKSLGVSALPVLTVLSASCKTPSNLPILKCLFAALTSNGIEPSQLVPCVMSGAFSNDLEADGCDVSSSQLDVVHCVVNACDNPSAALGLVINSLYDITHANARSKSGQRQESRKSKTSRAVMNTSVVAVVCSKLISRCGMNAAEQISALAKLDSPDISSLIVQHFSSPTFLRSLDTGESVTERTGAKSDDELSNAFICLFDALLQSKEDSESNRDRALGVLFGTASVNVLARCIKDSVSGNDSERTLKALRVLSQRLEIWELPFSSDRRRAPQARSDFVMEAARSLIVLLTATGEKAGVHEDRSRKIEMEHTAVSVLGKLNCVLGHANRSEMFACMKVLSEKLESAEMQAVVAKPSSSPQLAALGSGIAVCMASFVETMGTTVAAFVPSLTIISVTMIESALRSFAVTGSANGPVVRANGLSRDGDTSKKRASAAGGSYRARDDGPSNVESFAQEQSKLEKHSAVTIAESGLKVCETVIKRLPHFFGQSNIGRLATLATSTEYKPLDDTLLHAASCMKPAALLSAIAGALQACDGCAEADGRRGRILMMRVLEKTVDSMKKSEVKVQKEEILKLCLSALEHRTRVLRSARPLMDSGESLRGVREVERATSDTVLAFVLRLPEIEFKPLFNKLLEWNEAEELPDDLQEAAQESGLEIATNVLRANPTYAVVSTLFESLRGLFAPYFAQILDRTLGIVTMGRSAEGGGGGGGDGVRKGAVGKKRKRVSVEAAGAAELVGGQQRELIESGLRCLSQFLRRAPEGVTIGSAVIQQILDGLLTAFDQCRHVGRGGGGGSGGSGASEGYDSVTDAFCALGSRMVSIGQQTSGGAAGGGGGGGGGSSSSMPLREESRRLLGALSRGLLLRTREEGDGGVRAAACDAVRRVAGAVGEEFLVTLPEAMPFLADLVDDEEETVEASARKLVQLLETLSGEPILEQLKS